jgi:2-haloacid dehalogenase
MQDPLRSLVFDLGNVLIDWNPRYLYRKLFEGDEAAMDDFLARVCTPEWNAQQDAGRSCEAAIAEKIADYPDLAPLISAYYQRWPEMLGGSFPDTVELLEELSQMDLPLYALTNWSHETFPVARQRFPFLDLFDGIVVSGEERLLKPDPALYRRLLERFHIQPESALFIDDVAANVEGAQAVGMHAVHFAGAEELRASLRQFGVNV